MSPEAPPYTFPAMGGDVELMLVGGCDHRNAGVQALFRMHERAMSRFIPESELCALNASACTPFPASSLLFDAVSEAVGWACITEGVFDPTVIDVLEATGYDRPFEQMRQRERSSPRTQTAAPPLSHSRAGWRRIAMDFERESITLPADTRIDLGGLGKGYTVDRAIASIGPDANAMVNASGDLYAAGDGPNGDGWYIGVQDPLSPEHDVVVLNVSDRGIATSGTAKRHWGDGDQRYHHLIDTRQQRCSDSDLLAVTVVALTATQADVLAKTALLLGSRDGLRMIERFEGAESIAITPEGDTLTTSGIAEYFA